jgi:hypothetical protein
MRIVKVTVVQFDKAIARYEIPEMWLVGACYTREHDGMDPKQALASAIQHYHEQELMAQEAQS